MPGMTRREFIALIGGGCLLLAVKVKRAWGQQPAMPVIGFLAEGTPASEPGALAAFRRGLREAGYVEGQNPNRLPLERRATRSSAGVDGRSCSPQRDRDLQCSW